MATEPQPVPRLCTDPGNSNTGTGAGSGRPEIAVPGGNGAIFNFLAEAPRKTEKEEPRWLAPLSSIKICIVDTPFVTIVKPRNRNVKYLFDILYHTENKCLQGEKSKCGGHAGKLDYVKFVWLYIQYRH